MKKYLLFAVVSLIFLSGIGLYQYLYFHDGKLHVVFCDVGQGDGIFIRTPNGKNVLVDGGPGDLVLGCLSKHMPFWERRIDLMVLTHPHQDHFYGLNYVLDRYIVRYFVTEKLYNDTETWRDFVEKRARKRVGERFIYQGDGFRMGEDVFLRIEAPNALDLEMGSPNRLIGESDELASLVMSLKYMDFDLILTGDSQTAVLEKIFARNNQNSLSIEVLQAPHHGSKTGLSKTVIGSIAPKLAVISVGAKNRYGHPNKDILEMFHEVGVKVLCTDQNDTQYI